jgi:hypothetical protein
MLWQYCFAWRGLALIVHGAARWRKEAKCLLKHCMSEFGERLGIVHVLLLLGSRNRAAVVLNWI